MFVIGIFFLLLSFQHHGGGPVELHDVNGAAHAALPAAGQKAAVFLFVGIDCPISNGYAPEINRIIADYSKRGIDFSLVYADPTATADAVKKHAAAFGYQCPALLDPHHELVDREKVIVTPEVVILGPDGAKIYRGRIDNIYADFGKKRFAATTHELRDALDAIVNGRQAKVSETIAIGCDI